MMPAGGVFIAIELRLADADQDALSAFAAQTGRDLAAVPGITRVRWYRKLNDLRSLIVAEGAPDSADRILQSLDQGPATTDMVVGREVSDVSSVEVTETFGWPLLYTVSFAPPAEREDELSRWYDDEHVPLLQESPHWARTRRFEILRQRGIAATHLAVHYLSSIEALRSEARDKARRTAWRDRLAEEAWFRGGRYVLWVQERSSGQLD